MTQPWVPTNDISNTSAGVWFDPALHIYGSITVDVAVAALSSMNSIIHLSAALDMGITVEGQIRPGGASTLHLDYAAISLPLSIDDVALHTSTHLAGSLDLDASIIFLDPREIIYETFEEPELDLSTWTPYRTDDILTIEAGKAHFHFDQNSTYGWGTLESVAAINYTNSTIAVKVQSTGTAQWSFSAGILDYFAVYGGSNPRFVTASSYGNVQDDYTVPFSITYSYVRVRMIYGIAHYDTSQDGSSWIERHVSPSPIYVDGARLHFMISKNAGSPGDVYIDTVVVLSDHAVVVPPNDNFVNATEITLTDGKLYTSAEVYTAGLTTEPGEEEDRMLTAWWKFTPTVTGSYSIDTFQSSYTYISAEDMGTSLDDMDTSLDVYTGTSVDDLTLVAHNDDFDNETYHSAIFTTLQAGTTYYIRVSGWSGTGIGNYVLNVAVPVEVIGVTTVSTLSSNVGDLYLIPIIVGVSAGMILSSTHGGVWIPPVYSTQLPPRARYPQPVYSFVLFEPLTMEIITEVEDATSRSLSLKLKDSSSASFQLAYQSPNNDLINPLATGLLVYRNDINVFAGLVGPTQGSIVGGKHTISYVAEDYRGILKRRKVFAEDPIVERGLVDDAETLGWTMIDVSQKRDNGGLNIVRGTNGPVGVGGYFKANANDSIFAAINTLAGTGTQFDWDILWQDGKLYYQAWGIRGEQVTYALDFGGSILEATYTYAPENYGNAIRLTGAGGIQSNALSQYLGSSPRLELAVSDDSIKNQTQADARAQGLLNSSRLFTPTYSIKLSSAMWDPEQLWLGDAVEVAILPGRKDLVRVTEISLGMTEGESISVTLGATVPNVIQRVAGTYERVGRAESQVAQKAKTFIQVDEPEGAGIGDFWTAPEA